MIFYGTSMTILSYTLPSGMINYIEPFQSSNSPDISSVASDVQASLDNQLNIPVIDLGAMLFYSGNIIIDLFLNFAFAVPSMLTMLFNGLLFFIHLPNNVAETVQFCAFTTFSIVYVLSVVSLLVGIRSGRVFT